MLDPGDGLGPGQPGQGLVAVAGQQQALQVGAQATPLRQGAEQWVEPGGVVLQGARAGGQGRRLVIAAPPLPAPMGQPSTFPPSLNQQTTAMKESVRPLCGHGMITALWRSPLLGTIRVEGSARWCALPIEGGDGQPPTGKAGERFKVACGCQPPRSFWIRAKRYAPGPITCGVCGQDFQP